MVIIDHRKNIERIIEKIKNTPAIFDDGQTPGKLRSVIFGNPDNNDKLAIKAKPALFVTTKDSIQNTSYNFGQVTQNNQNQVTVEYEFVLIAMAKFNSEKSQKQLYDLLKNVRQVITDDPQFHDKDNEDPIFSRSIINGTLWDTKSKGQLITSISITLLATIGTAFSIDFPGIGNVKLLSKPNNPQGIVFTENRTQETVNRVLTNNGDFGSLSVEYESTSSLDEAFVKKLGIEEDITLNATGSRIIHVKYIDINSTAQYDQIERTILHMEIVK